MGLTVSVFYSPMVQGGYGKIEVGLAEAARITGKSYVTIMRYCHQGLYNYKRGKYRYTTLEAVHNYIARLHPSYQNLPEGYITPPGCDPIVPIELDPTPYGITTVEAANILEVSEERVYKLLADGKLRMVITPLGRKLITHDSLEEHLLRAETWHFKRAFVKAKHEIYGDIIAEAYKQARNEVRRQLQKEKRLAAKRARSQGKNGRPKGSRDTYKRKRPTKDKWPRLSGATEMPDEYEMHD